MAASGNFNLEQLAQHLQSTQHPDPSVRGAAETLLKELSHQPGFPVALLKLLTSQHAPDHIRLSSSIYFKRLVTKSWDNGEDTTKGGVAAGDRNVIKEHLVKLMLNSPKLIQSQLSSAVQEISKYDFPDKWESLMPEMTSKAEEAMKSGNFKLLCGVLETLNSIFKRYRYENKSRMLWREIKIVLVRFADPLLLMCEFLMKLTMEKSGDLPSIVKAMTLCVEMLLSLNSQDLPEQIEDRLDRWMEFMVKCLKLENIPGVENPDKSVPTDLEVLKTEVEEVCALYCSKYEEEYKPYCSTFVGETWNVVSKIDMSPRYDDLFSAALKFLVSAVNFNRSMFDKPELLQALCMKVILPNMVLRDHDIEEFEVNPQDYVRKDMEGSDRFTRRRTVVDLARGLCKYFEESVSSMLLKESNKLITEFNQNRSQWIKADTAMFLQLSIAVKEQTVRHGAVKVNASVNVGQFFQKYIVTELNQPDLKANPILKADCIKFIVTFRSQLPGDSYSSVLRMLIRYLQHDSYVVHSYAALAIYRLCTLRDMNSGEFKVPPEIIRPLLKELLEALFGALGHEDSSDNAYIMQAISQVCVSAQEHLTPVYKIIVKQIFSILERLVKHNQNAMFSHYAFNTLSGTIISVCSKNPAEVANFENDLFPLFQQMLNTEQCADFHPYVFQLISRLFTLRKDVAPIYMKLYPMLLNAELWMHSGNITPLTELLIVYLTRVGQQLVKDGKAFESILGVFQNLVQKQTNAHHGVEIVKTVIQYLPSESINKYMPEILRILLQKYSSTKDSMKHKVYHIELVVFFALLIHRYGVEYALKVLDGMQPGLLKMVITKLWFDNQKHVVDMKDRKLVLHSLVQLVSSKEMQTLANYKDIWLALVEKTIELFEENPERLIDDNSEEKTEYDIQASQLSGAAEKSYENIKVDFRANLRYPFAQVVQKACQDHPEFRQQLEKLKANYKKALQVYSDPKKQKQIG